MLNLSSQVAFQVVITTMSVATKLASTRCPGSDMVVFANVIRIYNATTAVYDHDN